MLDNGFRRKNKCPYCGYKTNAAQSHDDPADIPNPGDISFCLMCCEASQFTDKMALKKFDINSIKDIHERIRLKGLQRKMEDFWEAHPELHVRRKDYVK